jgi:site-specific recombinase XerD
VLRVWQHERAGNPDDPLFPTSRRSRLSRDAVAWLLAKHVATAAHACPSLEAKTISPHVLRHTAAAGLPDVWTMKTDGSDVRRVTFNPLWDSGPDWGAR